MAPSDGPRPTLRVVPVDEPGAADVDLPPVGVLAGKYRLERPLGRGGMGTVHLATHLGTGRLVALKLIAPGFMRDARSVERFQREARAAGRLRHPHIVDVTDFGFAEADGGSVAYLVMEYLDGCPLSEVLAEERRLPTERAVEILRQVGSAIHAAHLQGVVHRDIKPDNIWLQPDSLGGFQAKVLDFGIARLVDTEEEPASAGDGAGPVSAPTPAVGPSAPITVAGGLLGTPHYMSPEQCRGGTVDARSDVYALGVVAYRMLTGELPFDGDAASVMEAHRGCVPASPRSRNRDLPRGVDRLVMAALDKDPARRPASALAFTDGLGAHSQGLSRIFRRAFALYSEHFPLLLKLSVVAHIPVFATSFLAAGIAFSGWRPAGIAGGVLTAALGVLKVAAGVFTASTIAGLTALIVAQLEVAPLRRLEVRTAFGVLRRRWRPFFRTAALVGFGIVAGFALLIVPGLVVWTRLSMWAPVVLLEGLESRAALRRARELASRSWFSVVMATLFEVLLPWLFEGAKGANEAWVGREPGPWERAAVELAGLTGVFLLPLVTTVPALLYLKLRRLGGETLEELLDPLGTDVGRPAWERRIQARPSRPPSSSGRPT